MNYKAQLCFMRNNTAYFTTRTIGMQSGEHWDNNRAHMSGLPFKYDDKPWKIYKIKFDDLKDGHRFNQIDTPKQINIEARPWLSCEHNGSPVRFCGGMTITDFLEKMKEIDIEVYYTMENIEDLFHGFIWTIECLVAGGLGDVLGLDLMKDTDPNWWIYDLIPEFLSNPIYNDETWRKENSGHENQSFTTKYPGEKKDDNQKT